MGRGHSPTRRACAFLVAAAAVVSCHKNREAHGGISWERDHDAAFARARAEHRPLLLEFTATWCVPCRELDRLTYPHPRVRRAARRFVMVRIDASDPDTETERLLERYHVYSLPTILFFAASGKLLTEPRITGFEPPERFAEMMERVP